MISRRKFIGGVLGAGVGGPLLLKLWASDRLFPDGLSMSSVKVAAPAGWAGKTALFVTDVHYGYFFGPTEAAALNAVVSQHRPDVVLLGGDFAQTPKTDLSEFFRHWSPPCPTLFAPGNHDMDGTGKTASHVMKQTREAGITVLCNEAETWNGITFIGLPSALREEQRLSLLQTPGLKIVLAHEPDMWDFYAQPDLIHLAGHTHGGQIRLFGSALYLPTLGRKYSRGEYSRERNKLLIVGTGIGCTDVPARINCPPEIVKIEFA